MKLLLQIEKAIAKLPAKARRQLVQDIPALCPGEFPADGWDAILNDAAPRLTLSSLLDKLDSEHSQSSEDFLVLTEIYPPVSEMTDVETEHQSKANVP